MATKPCPYCKEEIQAEGKRGTFVGVRPNGAQLGEIAGLIDDGTLRVEIDTVYPLADAAKAHEASDKEKVRFTMMLRMRGLLRKDVRLVFDASNMPAFNRPFFAGLRAIGRSSPFTV